MGTCPSCGEEFRLSDATLFGLDEQRPEEALAAIDGMRAKIKEAKEALAKRRERMTVRAERTSQSVNLGKIVEKIAPSFSSFTYTASDCRALFEPIDYLIFSGMTRSSAVDSLVFVDIKSGKARLNDIQQSVKKRVEAGAVRFLKHS